MSKTMQNFTTSWIMSHTTTDHVTKARAVQYENLALQDRTLFYLQSTYLLHCLETCEYWLSFSVYCTHSTSSEISGKLRNWGYFHFLQIEFHSIIFHFNFKQTHYISMTKITTLKENFKEAKSIISTGHRTDQFFFRYWTLDEFTTASRNSLQGYNMPPPTNTK